MGVSSLTHTSPLFRHLKILKLPDLFIYQTLLILHDFLTGQLPQVLASKFQLQNSIRPLRTPAHFCENFTDRDDRQAVPNYRLYNYHNFRLFCRAPSLWNNTVASRIPNLNDIPVNKAFFKKVLKLLFLDGYQ